MHVSTYIVRLRKASRIETSLLFVHTRGHVYLEFDTPLTPEPFKPPKQREGVKLTTSPRSDTHAYRNPYLDLLVINRNEPCNAYQYVTPFFSISQVI